MKNALSIIALSLSALSIGSLAHAAPPSSVTRAQVQAELAAARAAGTIQQGEETLVIIGASTRDRADVRAELVAAAAAGTIQRGDATYVPPTMSTLTRATVTADLAAWNEAGLSDEWAGQQTPDIYSSTYRNKHVAYERAVSVLPMDHVATTW